MFSSSRWANVLRDKGAAVRSALSLPFTSKTTPPKTTPGLGDKMRTETSKTLEHMLKKGSLSTGLESIVKIAKGMPAGMPTGTPMPAWQADFHAARQHAAPVQTPAQDAPPPAANPMPHASWADAHKGVAAQRAQAQAGPMAPALPPPPPAAAQATPTPRGGGMGKFMRPGLGRTLGLAGIGAAGALAYGMHRQNARDRDRNSLVYAPMQGTSIQ